MKKLILLLMILALCMPGYGTVLVYKVTTSFNPMISFSGADETAGTVAKVKMDTFVVFEINSNYDVNIPPDTVVTDPCDPNNIISSLRSPNQPIAIVTAMINKNKVQMKLGGSDPNSAVFIDRDANRGIYDSIAPFTDTTKGKTSDTVVFIEIVDNDSSFDVYTEMFGKSTSADIGKGKNGKLSIAKSMSGNADIWEESPLITGFGTAKATLDPRYTKLANTSGKSVSEVATQIQADLSSKGFQEVDSIP